MSVPKPKIGDLRVWHIPQVPGKAFTVPVTSVEEGVKILEVLAKYDLFQFDENIKPDYSNANGLSIFEKIGKQGDWMDWYGELDGEPFDDPEAYLEAKKEKVVA